MPGTRRNRKLARWGRETAARERPLDEVPADAVTRIVLPAHEVPVGQRPVDADAAVLAVTWWRCAGGCAVPVGSLGGAARGRSLRRRSPS